MLLARPSLAHASIWEVRPWGVAQKFALLIRWALVLVVVSYAALITLTHGLRLLVPPSGEIRHVTYWDYSSFITSGRAFTWGLNPYATWPGTAYPQTRHLSALSPNLNPPISVPIFAWAAQWPTQDSFRVWFGVSAALYLLTAALLLYAYRSVGTWWKRAVWLISLAGLWQMFALGQIYAPLALCGAVAFLLARRGHQTVPGILIGVVVAIKPTIGLWLVLLWLAGHRRSAVAGVLTAATISAVPLILYGPEIYRQWVAASLAFQGTGFVGNMSLASVFARMQAPWLGYLVTAILTAGLLGWAWQKRPSWRETSHGALLGGLLVGPIAWAGYILLALPTLLERPWGRWERVGAGLLVVPFWIVWSVAQTSRVTYVVAGSFYVVALLCFFIPWAREQGWQGYLRPLRPAVSAILGIGKSHASQNDSKSSSGVPSAHTCAPNSCTIWRSFGSGSAASSSRSRSICASSGSLA